MSNIHDELTVCVFLSSYPEIIRCIFRVLPMCQAVKVTELLFLLRTFWERGGEGMKEREEVGGGKEEVDEMPPGWRKEKEMTWF